jgi:hypothetical protein
MMRGEAGVVAPNLPLTTNREIGLDHWLTSKIFRLA